MTRAIFNLQTNKHKNSVKQLTAGCIATCTDSPANISLLCLCCIELTQGGRSFLLQINTLKYRSVQIRAHTHTPGAYNNSLHLLL